MEPFTFTLTQMTGSLYANYDPEDPWTREHYLRLRLDEKTYHDLGEPETITVTIGVPVDDS